MNIDIKDLLIALLLTVAMLTILPLLLVLPVRCGKISITKEVLADTSTPRASRVCYAVYHKKFWTEMEGQPTEIFTGRVPLDGWFHYGTNGIPVNDGIYPYSRVETRIFHH